MSDPRYHVLFLLEADTDLLFEIQRLDVQSEHPADVYFWFRFDKDSGMLNQLDFENMRTLANGEQERDFTQGQLCFNTTTGIFSPKDGSLPLLLSTVTPSAPPSELKTALFAFLASIPIRT
ncbi:hypothetical protein [Hymenobacter aerophilus]|uniref:hypothetical protein n=1 Tax=Hymenobacter aerophilus TaxID=119644 RepID=UPI00037FBD42|nr:hypothetical protein [Hymenobacter aerophilus]